MTSNFSGNTQTTRSAGPKVNANIKALSKVLMLRNSKNSLMSAPSQTRNVPNEEQFQVIGLNQTYGCIQPY